MKSQFIAKLHHLIGKIYWREALLCSPAIMIVIALSLEIDPLAAVIMVGAAFSAGFGASRTLGKYRWGAVSVATVGMAFAAVLGSVVGDRSELLFVILALFSAGCAYLTGRNNDLWWVSLQIVVAFLVASYYPRGLDYALLRGLLILIGGFLQLGGMILFAKCFPELATVLPSAPVTSLAENQRQRFIGAVVGAVILSFILAKAAGIANDYWAPMTVLIIIRPTGEVTLSRVINRLIGTLIGCSAATLIIYLFHDNLYVLLIALTFFSALAFSMQKAHYLLLSSLISATIVFLIAIGFGDPIATTEHRLIATSLGGLVTLATVKLFRL